MKPTIREIEVLRDIWRHAEQGKFLPKAYFDSFPRKRQIAKDFMWGGYIESVGSFGGYVSLTPAGCSLLAARAPGDAKRAGAVKSRSQAQDTCPRCGGPTHEREILCARCDAIVEGDASGLLHDRPAPTSGKLVPGMSRPVKPRSQIKNPLTGTWAKPGYLKAPKAKAK